MDTDEGGHCFGKFAKIRISKKINQPLSKGLWISPEGGGAKICIVLLYERLPNFCFACGRIGHIVPDCIDASANKDELGFGSWIKAPSFVSGRKSGSSKVSEGSENTNSSSQAIFKPLVDEQGALFEADCQEASAIVACNLNVNESLVDCPIDLNSQENVKEKSPSCLVFSSNVVNYQVSPDTMVCGDATAPVKDKLIALTHNQSSQSKWKRLNRSKGKEINLIFKAVGSKRSLDSETALASVHERGKKVSRVSPASWLSSAEAAEQPRRSQ